MARNEEKAQSMLNRWLAVKAEKTQRTKKRRPFLASHCRDLEEAKKWRLEIVREISRKVLAIQNPGLGEHRIRDLNDMINKLIREKGHWERQIATLGGPNYALIAPPVMDANGKPALGTRGYMYFGAARELTGVRELFRKDDPADGPPKRTRAEMYRMIDADYYGYRDDDDGILESMEKEVETEAVKKAVEAHRQHRKKDAEQAGQSASMRLYEALEDASSDDEDMEHASLEFKSHVPLPDKEDIERLLLEKRKQDLLKQYASEELQTKQRDTRGLVTYVQ